MDDSLKEARVRLDSLENRLKTQTTEFLALDTKLRGTDRWHFRWIEVGVPHVLALISIGCLFWHMARQFVL